MIDGRAPINVAVLDMSTPLWSAGGIYTTVLARSLHMAADPGEFHLTLVGPPQTVARCKEEKWGLDVAVVEDPDPRPASLTSLARRGAEMVSKRLGDLFGARGTNIDVARGTGADVLVPVVQTRRLGSTPAIGWIPDFQHVRYPHFFSQEEIATRDRTYRRTAEVCRLVMLSSDAMRSDFERFAPQHAAKARVARFPSSLVFEERSDDPQSVLGKYGIPKRFVLVINQFWRHKNHLAVVEAARIAAERGISIPVVMVGTPADYRDPRNQTVSEVLQAIARYDLRSHFWVLGEVPRGDLVDLLRCAAAMVQPSRSEGWSTSVQDAFALGRPIICSDTDVMREQVPDALGFFDPDRPDQLADALVDVWVRDDEGTLVEREKAALARAKEEALAYGTDVLKMCREAVST